MNLLSGILYGRDPQALKAVGILLHEYVRRISSDECRMVSCVCVEDLKRAAVAYDQWHFACVDIGDGRDVDIVPEVRLLCGQVELLLMVNADVSPMAYIRPGIMPTGLVQRPSSTELVREVVEEFARHLLETHVGSDDKACFLVEGKDGVVRLPFTQLVCFESRDKRIVVRTNRREYAYYDTLDSLQNKLPESFMRCHRSFIINARRVRQLRLGESRIEMDDGSQIPVSRSYKSKVKERLT